MASGLSARIGNTMSKYHPLDVRHPSNRDLTRRDYLLDPIPARSAAPQPARASGARTEKARPATAGVQQPAAPWSSTTGRNRAAAPPATSPAPGTATRRAESALGGLMGFLRSLIIFGIILIVLAQQTDILDPVILQLRLWALDLGFRLPF